MYISETIPKFSQHYVDCITKPKNVTDLVKSITQGFNKLFDLFDLSLLSIFGIRWGKS
jgi:hypothetical protein